MNKRILHVVNIFFVLPYFLGDQFDYFKNKGYKEYIVCSPSSEIEQYSIAHGFSYKEIPILRSFSVFKDILAIIKIMTYISKSKIDIVVGHTPKGAFLAMVASYLARVPIRIYFRHGLVYETSSGLKRFLFILIDRITAKLSTKIVCVSPSVYKQSLRDKLNSERKQLILSKGTCNGINVDYFNKFSYSTARIELKNKLSIPADNFIVGYTGRLVSDKGIIELVNAFIRLIDIHPEISLILVGMFETRNSLPEEIISFIKENPNIICTGYIRNDEIAEYYSIMDVFVLPSYREGFPTSILEASSMEIPILTTRVTGCIDAIVEGETGCFIEHNEESIVNSILQFINNPILRAKFGTQGRNFVVNNFRQDKIWAEIEELYK